MTDTVDFAHTDYAVEQRKEKARAIGRTLWVNGHDRDSALALSDNDWRAVAHAAGKNPPGDETRTMAVLWLGWLLRTEGPPPTTEHVQEPVHEHVHDTSDRPNLQVREPGTCLHAHCPHAARLYAAGWLCDEHSPWRAKGIPFQDEVKAAADAALAAKMAGLSPSPA